VSFLRSGEFLAAGSTRNFVAAIKGLIAGLRGEKGRPDHILARHTAPNPSALDRRSQSNTADTEDVTLES
jgi:hypothetical protein